MATFKEYKNSKGERKWMARGYLGVDYVTGKQNNFKRAASNQNVQLSMLLIKQS